MEGKEIYFPLLIHYELGYKGVVGNRFSFGIDVYYFRRKGGASFREITPSVSIETEDLYHQRLGEAVGNNAMGLIEQGLIDLGFDPITAAFTTQQLAPQVQGAYTMGGEGFVAAITSEEAPPFQGIVQIVEKHLLWYQD